MAKTYGTVTTFTAGNVLTAAQLNVAGGAVNNLVVPAACQVRLTSNVTSYADSAAISWSSSAFDTDGMFSSGTAVTIQTTGIYLITFYTAVSATATLTAAAPKIFIGGVLAAQNYLPAVSSTASSGSVSIVSSLAASSVISVGVGFSGGSAYVVNGAATETNNQTRLSVVWIGRTS